jgi:hypothetical protein
VLAYTHAKSQYVIRNVVRVAWILLTICTARKDRKESGYDFFASISMVNPDEALACQRYSSASESGGRHQCGALC